jgi:hypothetical protein
VPDHDDFASISTWLEAIHHAIKEHTESVTKYQQSEESQRQQLAETEINTAVRLPAEVTEYYHSEQGERPVKNLRENVRIILEIGAVVAAFALAGITLFTLHTFNRQLTQMKEQTKTLSQQAAQSAQDSRQQLELSRKQVVAAQGSVKAIEGQTRQDQRSWIKFEIGKLPDVPRAVEPPKPGDPEETPQFLPVPAGWPLTIPLRFTNIGKTAAQNIVAAVCIQMIKKGQEPNIPQGRSPYLTENGMPDRHPTLPGSPAQVARKAILYPQETFKQTFSRMQFTASGESVVGPTVTPEEAESITIGTSYIVIWGQVWYSDVFDIRHWTRFCEETSFDGGVAPSKKCAGYSSVDDN